MDTTKQQLNREVLEMCLRDTRQHSMYLDLSEIADSIIKGLGADDARLLITHLDNKLNA